MNVEVPYMLAVKNLPKILDAIQNAGAPEAFGLDFLKDLGFTSSNDRGVIKLLKYLGMLDSSGKPLTPYREFMDHNQAKGVLANRLRVAYDDLFTSDKDAHTRTSDKLKGWFKTKTGAGDAVAKKMAATFKSLATYADFSAPAPKAPSKVKKAAEEPAAKVDAPPRPPVDAELSLGLSYRIELHLPDTTSIDTYRIIFRALREELLS